MPAEVTFSMVAADATSSERPNSGIFSRTAGSFGAFATAMASLLPSRHIENRETSWTIAVMWCSLEAKESAVPTLSVYRSCFSFSPSTSVALRLKNKRRHAPPCPGSPRP